MTVVETKHRRLCPSKQSQPGLVALMRAATGELRMCYSLTDGYPL